MYGAIRPAGKKAGLYIAQRANDGQVEYRCSNVEVERVNRILSDVDRVGNFDSVSPADSGIFLQLFEYKNGFAYQ
jgi:hypothetical protein